MVLLSKVSPSGRAEVVMVELPLVMPTFVISLPAHTLWIRLVEERVTDGFTVTVTLSEAVAVQDTSLVFTVAVATTVYSVVSSGDTVMLLGVLVGMVWPPALQT